MNSILKSWVSELGIRYQGVLLSAIRGCDSSGKDDPVKAFVRCYRETILNPACGDPAKCASFIELVEEQELLDRFHLMVKNLDPCPMHYVMHLIHAIQIVGVFHPDPSAKALWDYFYRASCNKLHVSPELRSVLEVRLEATEEDFGRAQQESYRE